MDLPPKDPPVDPDQTSTDDHVHANDLPPIVDLSSMLNTFGQIDHLDINNPMNPTPELSASANDNPPTHVDTTSNDDDLVKNHLQDEPQKVVPDDDVPVTETSELPDEIASESVTDITNASSSFGADNQPTELSDTTNVYDTNEEVCESQDSNLLPNEDDVSKEDVLEKQDDDDLNQVENADLNEEDEGEGDAEKEPVYDEDGQKEAEQEETQNEDGQDEVQDEEGQNEAQDEDEPIQHEMEQEETQNEYGQDEARDEEVQDEEGHDEVDQKLQYEDEPVQDEEEEEETQNKEEQEQEAQDEKQKEEVLNEEEKDQDDTLKEKIEQVAESEYAAVEKEETKVDDVNVKPSEESSVSSETALAIAPRTIQGDCVLAGRELFACLIWVCACQCCFVMANGSYIGSFFPGTKPFTLWLAVFLGLMTLWESLGLGFGSTLNPSVSVAMFLSGQGGEGCRQKRDLIVSLMAQLMAHTIGIWVSRCALGGPTTAGLFAPPVPDVEFLVGKNSTSTLIAASLVEGMATCMMCLVYLWVGRKMEKAPVTKSALPIAVILLLVGSLANITGASMNPFYQLGLAFWEGNWRFHFAYWAGPMLGAALAAAIHNVIVHGSLKCQPQVHVKTE